MNPWSSELNEIKECYERLKGRTDAEKLLSEIIAFNGDPRAILTRSRSVVEAIALELGDRHAIKRKKGVLEELLTELRRKNVIPEEIFPALNHVKSLGNLGAHPYEISDKHARDALVSLMTVLTWYEGLLDNVSTQQSTSTPKTLGCGLRIALIFRHNASQDERIRRILQASLESAGHLAIAHSHTRFSEEWQHQIASDMSNADVALVLLSPESVYSEMLMYEVELAYQASQRNAGKPRLVTVKLNNDLPLPQELANLLGSKFLTWQNQEDDQTLVSLVLDELSNPQSRAPRYELEMVGGAIPLDSKFYLERHADADFKKAILRHDSIVLLKGARQVGKTSLLARGLQTAREAGFLVVLIDLQRFIEAQLQNLETFFIAIGEMLADQLHLDVYPQDKWRPGRAPNLNFENYFLNEILGKTDQPVLWAIDEADRLFLCNFSGEFFALFRTWHNQRALNPSSPCSRLILAIAYATETYLFIKDPNQSPFNVGTKIPIEDFTLEQVAELNRRYGLPLSNEQELRDYHRLTGGQPYLVRCGLNEMVTRGLGLESLSKRGNHEEGPFGDHLRRILLVLRNDPHLAQTVRGVLQGAGCSDEGTFDQLRRGGVMKGDCKTDARLRCELYEIYLSKHLL